mmetsp:Transcript_14144/g.32740  ORF Transcript_14144/g.32740 Transcript_14144/m.32740 type:complete len:222 (-) Transcript_14144:20-685(-)
MTALASDAIPGAATTATARRPRPVGGAAAATTSAGNHLVIVELGSDVRGTAATAADPVRASAAPVGPGHGRQALVAPAGVGVATVAHVHEDLIIVRQRVADTNVSASTAVLRPRVLTGGTTSSPHVHQQRAVGALAGEVQKPGHILDLAALDCWLERVRHEERKVATRENARGAHELDQGVALEQREPQAPENVHWVLLGFFHGRSHFAALARFIFKGRLS